MPVVIVSAAVVFVLSHLAIWRLHEPDYNRAFKLSRGLAALVLTLLGLAGLIGAAGAWRTGFLYRHEPGDWMLLAVSIAYGHLIADFVSMGFGRFALGIRPRRDLVAHHGLGLLAYGLAMLTGVGYALVLVSLASEIMPFCSGLEAWGRGRGHVGLQRGAARARLWVLVGWRLPLWGFTLAMLVRTLVAGEVPEGLALIWGFVLASLGVLVGLDVYWVRACLAPARVAGQPPGEPG